MKNLIICLLITGYVYSLQSPLHAQTPQQLFQKGLIQEEGEGNLNKAIEIYNSIVNDVSLDRGLRAKSLLHVGICYEKLGNQNARKTYQKLISEYSDQKDIVSLGREKLKGLKKADPIAKTQGIVASQVWSPAQDTYGVSPNGRYLNYIDWENISINIKDLHTGKSRQLSKTGTWNKPVQFPDKSIWSPDGKQLAYFWFDGNNTELHIINTDGSNNRIIAKGISGHGPWPVTWTRDGKNILVFIKDKEDGTDKTEGQKIVLLSVDSGATKDLKRLKDLDFGGHIDMSPDDNYIVYTLDQNENTAAKDIYILSMDGSIDQKLVGDMANDSNPKWSPDGKEILFISDRYGSNDLWSLKIVKGKPIGVEELVKPNLGSRTYLHGFTYDKALYYGFLNLRSDIYTVNLDENSGSDFMKPYKISNLQEKMNGNPVWSTDGRYVCYYRWQKFRHDILGEQYHITIYDTETRNVQNLNTNIYGGQFLGAPSWSQNGEKLLYHGMIKKEFQFGYFSFDIDSKKITTIKSKKNTSRSDMEGKFNTNHTFSNDSKSIFTLSNDQKRIIKIDINSKKETTIFTGKDEILQFKLSNDNNKIAYGYMGKNRNELYIVSTSGGDSKKILSTEIGTTPYDFYWDKKDKFLYFLEGKFGNVKKIMRISVDGGTPEQYFNITDAFSSGRIRRVKIHPDGKQLVVELVVGKGQEVWKLEGIFDN